MQLRSTRETPDALRHLPTRARPVVDAADVAVPEGYDVEAVLVGLSFPCDLAFDDEGAVYISEGGSTWPTRPYLPARILRLDPDGRLEEFTREVLPGPRGMTVHDGGLYVSAKGGYHMHIDRYDLATRERTVIVDGIPNGGWHEPGGPVFGPDGLMYFGQGSVSLQGAVLPAGFTVDLAKHPSAHDVPGQDVTLTGNDVWSRDPRLPYPYLTRTGPFKPFGVPSREGEVVEGRVKCSSGVWRCRPDGSGLELLAWGIRNPFGMAMGEDGELFVADNDFEEKGERSIGQDPDRIWRIRNAKRPYGSVDTPDWYGFPDYGGDGLPVWHESHRPNRGTPAQPFLKDPPPVAGPAFYLEEPHTGMAKMDVCRSDAFGHRGDLFACEWGTMAPLNSIRREQLRNGFRVLRIDPETAQAETFMANREPGPASRTPGSGGIERPVSCRFSPDGRSLYVLDFGVAQIDESLMVVFGHTGVLWRVTKREGGR